MFQKSRVLFAIALCVGTLVSLAACGAEPVNVSAVEHEVVEGSGILDRPDGTQDDNIIVEPESSSMVTENSEADAAIASFGNIGEDYLLHSCHYRQGEPKSEESADLGWDGDMLLCVKSAEIMEYSPNTDEIDPVKKLWNVYNSDFVEPCTLKLSLSLENINAENKNGVRYQFRADMFKLAAYEDLIPENYQDSEFYTMTGERMGAHEASFNLHSEGDDYYCFDLQPGESIDFTMEFLVDRVYFQQDRPFLGIGHGRYFQVGVMLDDLSKE